MMNIHDTINITTDRLLLRPIKLIDIIPIIYLAGDPNVSKWTSSFTTPFNHQQSQHYVEKAISEMDSGHSISLSIIIKQIGLFAGVISLKLSENTYPELGYWIGSKYQKNGYCTEADSSILLFGFSKMKLSNIVGVCAHNNAASQNVMLRCGMKEIPGKCTKKVIKGELVSLVSYMSTPKLINNAC